MAYSHHNVAMPIYVHCYLSESIYIIGIWQLVIVH